MGRTLMMWIPVLVEWQLLYAKTGHNEAKLAGKTLGIQYEVLDNFDGELIPT